MNPLMVAGTVVLVFAMVVTLAFAASALALLAFRLAPALSGTILALTTSDIAWMLRQMPLYPAWWPGRELKQREKKFVMLALNPVERPEYFCGFDQLHRPLFTPNKGAGLRYDLADRLPIEFLIRRLQDEHVDVFIMFVEKSRTTTPRVLLGSRYMKHGLKWYDLRPPRDFPPGRRKTPSETPPLHLLVSPRASKQTVSPRPR